MAGPMSMESISLNGYYLQTPSQTQFQMYYYPQNVHLEQSTLSVDIEVIELVVWYCQLTLREITCGWAIVSKMITLAERTGR